MGGRVHQIVHVPLAGGGFRYRAARDGGDPVERQHAALHAGHARAPACSQCASSAAPSPRPLPKLVTYTFKTFYVYYFPSFLADGMNTKSRYRKKNILLNINRSTAKILNHYLPTQGNYKNTYSYVGVSTVLHSAYLCSKY